MTKVKYIRLLLLIFSGMFIFSTIKGISLGENHNLSEFSGSDEEFEQLKIGRVRKDFSDGFEVWLDDYPTPYDSRSNSFLYSVTGRNPLATNPTVFLRSDSIKSIKLITLGTLVPEMMAGNDGLKIMFYTDDSFMEAELRMTSLPIAKLIIPEERMVEDTPISEKDIKATFMLYDNDSDTTPIQRYLESGAVVHLRGGSSRYYPKNSYRLSLNQTSVGGNVRTRQVSLLGMRQDDDWILTASYNDPEKTRVVMSNNIWHDMAAYRNVFAVENASQGRNLELFINDEYWGIYTLMQPVDAKSLSLVEDSDPALSEYIYRSVSYETADSQTFQEAKNSNLAGGYELRNPDNNWDTYEKWEPLDLFLQTQKALTKQAIVTEEEVNAFMDLDNFIDLALWVDIVMGVDNRGKNLTFTAKMEQAHFVMLTSPWDYDQTWGMIWTGEKPFFTYVNLLPDAEVNFYLFGIDLREDKSNPAPSFSLPGLDAGIRDRYAELRLTVLSDAAIEEMLKGYEADNFDSGAFLRDHERWPEAAFAEDMETYKQFVWARFAYLDQKYLFTDVEP